MFFPGRVAAQSVQGKIIDSTTKRGIPFVYLAHTHLQSAILTDLKGNFNIKQFDRIEISHPFYENKSVTFDSTDSNFIIELNKKSAIKTTGEQLMKGDHILSTHHEYLPETSADYHDSFEFLSYTKIEVLEQSNEKIARSLIKLMRK